MSEGNEIKRTSSLLRTHVLRHKNRRRIVSVAVLPTLCTLGNLIAGFAAIHYAAKAGDDFAGPWGWTGLTLAGFLIFVGIFFDGIDGSIARITQTSSSIGAQLDTIADVVTFGVAPAFIALRLMINHLEATEPSFWLIGPEAGSVYGKIIWGIAAAYVCCAALRLARFSVESGLDNVNEHRLFKGLPSPGAAGALASLIILHQHLLVTKFAADVPTGFVQGATLGIPFIMLLCAFGMVSSIPYVHVANQYVRGQKSFGYIVRLVIVLALAIWWLQETLAVVFTLYAISGPARIIWKAIRRRTHSHPAQSQQESEKVEEKVN